MAIVCYLLYVIVQLDGAWCKPSGGKGPQGKHGEGRAAVAASDPAALPSVMDSVPGRLAPAAARAMGKDAAVARVNTEVVLQIVSL